MFNKKDISLELANSMESHLISNTIEKHTEGLNKLATAIDHISDAAEVFDNLGMNKEAEALTTLLEIIAGKKSKKKSKSKKHKKTVDPATKGLTGEKMVKNLKEKGWVFNANDQHVDGCKCDMCMDTNDAKEHKHSSGCMCSMCMDVNDVRHGDDCVCHICMKDDKDANDVEDHEKEYSMNVHWIESNDDENDHIDIKESEPFNFDDTSIDRNHSDDDNYAEMFRHLAGDMNDFEDEV